ncbi:hypothetical protein IFM89_000588 [Coptis chinensis]|uniref:Pentatricopeptide repeat-containing protein n=1 Tax=Coptis chinensis TaxID=261450 RepID=A0A835HAM2_9MAGN|nr:hypothetical protein IFM89_000588 [Coptis chinensis]
MMDVGCLPNTQSCMFLIRLCKKQEKVQMALVLWKDMVEKGFGSYILVSDVLLDLLFDLGKFEEADNCFLQMVEKGHKPSNVSFRRIKFKDLDEQLILSCCPRLLLQGSTTGVEVSKRLYGWQQAPVPKMCNIYVVYDRTKGTKMKEEEQNLSKNFLIVVMDNASEFLVDGSGCFMSQSVPGNRILHVEVGCCV